jgi:hypothetical protein
VADAAQAEDHILGKQKQVGPSTEQGKRKGKGLWAPRGPSPVQ